MINRKFNDSAMLNRRDFNEFNKGTNRCVTLPQTI